MNISQSMLSLCSVQHSMDFVGRISSNVAMIIENYGGLVMKNCEVVLNNNLLIFFLLKSMGTLEN